MAKSEDKAPAKKAEKKPAAKKVEKKAENPPEIPVGAQTAMDGEGNVIAAPPAETRMETTLSGSTIEIPDLPLGDRVRVEVVVVVSDKGVKTTKDGPKQYQKAKFAGPVKVKEG